MKKISVEKKFLMLPVCEESDVKKLLFYKEGKLIFDLDVRLAPSSMNQPCTYCYINMEMFGETVDICTEPETDFEIRFSESDITCGLYKEARRPLIHFTAKRGWLNDPNGLVEYISPVTGKKTYHMFFQHNPCSVKWGNMHWGHAVSDDLIHWNQLDCALYPDEMGTMYSGSAIVDKENKSGLKQKDGKEDVILLYYTAAGKNSRLSQNAEFTQCLAYSNDGGLTFTKYEKNPVINHIIGGNRDPKVIWCDPLKRYVLALYLDGNTYGLFTSDNLTEWTKIQEISIEGDAECPDFYPLTCKDNGTEKWILSGASHVYLIGDISGGRFVPSQKEKRLHYGTHSYASQTYSDISDGRRINAAWDRVTIPDSIFNSQMGIPVEHTLKLNRKNGEYYICANPISEFESLRNEKSIPLSGQIEGDFTADIGEAAEIIITSEEPERDSSAKISVFGKKFVWDIKNNELSYGKQKSPVSIIGDNFKIRMICDKNSIEIYSGSGEIYHAIENIAENTDFSISSSSKLNIKTYNLNSIWQQNPKT